MPQKNKKRPTLSITKSTTKSAGPKTADPQLSKKTKRKKLPSPSLSLILKTRDQKLKELLKVLKAKDKALREHKKVLEKSQQVMKEVAEAVAWQFKMAQNIHHILLPSELPVIPGCKFSFKFQPAEKDGAGKDFYEISPHTAFKSFSITLSSSASYSLSALLFSARLKMMGRRESSKPLLPEEFLNQLREELHQTTSPEKGVKLAHLSSLLAHNRVVQPEPSGRRDLKKDRQRDFTTLPPPLDKISFFHTLINQKTWQMFYALTGNIVALVYHVERGEIKQLTPSTLKQSGKSPSVCLNGRDRLVVLSPGVFQVRDLEGKQYTLSKVKKILKEEQASSVHEIRNRIFYELKVFSKGQASESDQSVLVMEVKPQILRLAT